MDAGVDAPESIVRRDADLDADRDAHVQDADLPRPESIWRNPDVPDCSLFQDARPRWEPPSPPGEPGRTRWIVSSTQPALGIVRTWDVPPPTRASLFEPVLTGSGAVIWTWSDWLETGLAYETGASVHFGASAMSRTAEPVETNFTRFPRMWLPARNAVYFGNGWTAHALRAPTFDIMDAPTGTRAFPAIGVRDAAPYFNASPARDSWMPAWSPETGDIIARGFSSDSRGGVVSGCEDGVRWATEVPTDGDGSIFVRENGEVVVVTTYELHVLDGATGEPLRSALVRLPGSSDYNRAAAYQPGCGVLFEKTVGSTWAWFDLDRMEDGPLLRGRTAATRMWSGTEDCGIVEFTGDRIVRIEPFGAIRFDVPAPSGTFGPILPPVPLLDGGTALLLQGAWYRVSAEGDVSEVTRLDAAAVGVGSAGRSVLAPDGTLFYLTDSGGEFRASATPTGLLPGPFLWPQSGLNWARTNSVLAE